MMRAMLGVIGAFLLAGCAPAVQVSGAPATQEAAIKNDVKWVRTAAEHRAIFIQTYRAATYRVRELAAGRAPGTWAVILDADETILDNSEYQRRIMLRGERYDTETWNAWVREVAADSLPGAAGFIRTVRELGGRVAIVTNRDEETCAETRQNFGRLSIVVDVVLCQAPDDRGKQNRFNAVQRGTTPAALPPLEVIMYVGDNIQDFPEQTQQLRGASAGAFDEFGRTWFIVPNPMYGSWERNEFR